MPTHPNIVLIMTDQHRADFSAAEGYPLDPTPAIDRLGEQGARFRHAYTPMPTCGPARTSLLTGRFPKATRVRENSSLGNASAIAHLPGVLRDHGYATYLAGKNHSFLPDTEFDWASTYMHTGGGHPDRRTEDDADFDAWLESLDHGVHPVPSSFPLEHQQPHRIVSDAIHCVSSHDANRPFFLWLSFPEPHNPYQVPEPYFSMFPEADIPERIAGPEAIAGKGPKWQWLRSLIEEKRPGYDDAWRRYSANYLGMLRLIDDQVDRFLTHLDTTGQRDSTVIIFLSDHGDYAGDYGLQRKGVGLPECLVRVPLIFQGPGIVACPDMRTEFVSLVDVFPTLCDMLGLPIPAGVQGRSLWPILTGDTFPKEEFRGIFAELGVGGVHYDVTDRPLLHFPYEGPSFDELNSVTQSGNLKMIRMDDWKLTFDSQGNGELYDLAADPGELVNLYGMPDHASRQLALTTELLQWTIRTEDDLPGGRYTRKLPPRNWLAGTGWHDNVTSLPVSGSASLNDRLDFVVATDALKHIRRANRTVDGSRQETVAEHTWHVTLLALLFADAAPEGTVYDRVRDLLIAHDLVEIHAGDTVIWDNVPAAETAAREAAAADRLFALLPDCQRDRFTALWREFDAQETIEARFARALDALHPMLMSWGPGGIGHPNPNLRPAMVLARKRPFLEQFPVLWGLAQSLVQAAADRGLIAPDSAH